MNIFTITLINSIDEKTISCKDTKRCIGYYIDINDAINAVQKNKGEMHECLYNYLVIEEIPQGVWTISVKELWYNWNETLRAWESCKKPLKYYNFCDTRGFGIG